MPRINRTLVSTVLTFATLCLCLSSIEAQQLERTVIGNCGNFYSNSSGSLSFTIGQTSYKTLTQSNSQLTQGFQQPDEAQGVDCGSGPVANCKGIGLFLDATGNGSISANQINNASSSSCGIDSMSLSKQDFDCSNLGTNTVILTVTDLVGQTATCSANVSVTDSIPPALSCQSINDTLNPNGYVVGLAAKVVTAQSDNCGNLLSLVAVPDTLDCSNQGSHVVTLTATDSSGNMASCTATVTVADSSEIQIDCPDDTSLTCAFGVTYSVLVVENCPGFTFTQTAGLPSGSDYPSGVTLNSFSATDAQGNTDTCSFSINIIGGTIPDTVVPKILRAPDDTIPLPLIKKHAFGSAVNGIGDINGDGNVDLAVGASSSPLNPTAPFKSKDAGEVFILLFDTILGDIQAVSHIGANRDGAFQVHPDSLPKKSGFGAAVVGTGDLDGDGVGDICIGEPGFSPLIPGTTSNAKQAGSVDIFFLNSDASVKNWHRISNNRSGFPDTLDEKTEFGGAIATIGDLNNDGFNDLAVGAIGDRSDDKKLKLGGAVYILFMNSGGTVSGISRIGDGIGGLPQGTLQKKGFFGSDIANLGDIDGDGVTDIAVGALGYSPLDGDGKKMTRAGAVYVLFLQTDGTVKNHSLITADASNNYFINKGDVFGLSLARVLDQDGDGINDLAVGAPNADPIDPVTQKGIKDAGRVHLVLLNSDGTMKSSAEINPDTSVIQQFAKKDNYGSSIGALNDVCFTILAVGASGDDNPIIKNGKNKKLSGAGAVYLSIPKTLTVSGKSGALSTVLPDSFDETASNELDARLSEISSKDLVRFYPNPTDGLLNIEFLGDEQSNYRELKLYDLMGRKINQWSLSQQKHVQLNLQGLSAGQYVIQVIGSNDSVEQLMIVE